MNNFMNWIAAHPVAWGAITAFVATAIQYVWAAFIGALPAPTAQSTPKYQFWFKFFNILAANISRAQNTRVESSPNFQDAVNSLNKQTGEPKMVVQVPEVKP